ncbi:MAG: hypothetical protein ABL901_01005 [Hyphomicrobiaceae bacterium]
MTKIMDRRSPCKPPPNLRDISNRQAQILAYIRAEIEAGRGEPSKRKIVMRFGKPSNVKALLSAAYERSGLLREAT